MIDLFSFFSGAGLLELGFQSEGFRVVFVNEPCLPFLDAYKHSRKSLQIEEPEHGYFPESIEALLQTGEASVLRDRLSASRRRKKAVGFIGGPPCPDFSVGGKNRGRHGDTGRLSLTYIELINMQKPDFFLFENVEGLWRTKLHRNFYEELRRLLKDAGYLITDRLINAIEYGVPQNRRRIILFGVNRRFAADYGLLRGASDGADGEVPEGLFPWKRHLKYPGRAAFAFPWPGQSAFREDSVLPKPDGIPEELTVEHWFRKNEVSSHPNSVNCFNVRAGRGKFQSVPEGDVSKRSFKRLHRWRYSPTACYGNNEVHLHPYKLRRLSVAEALALQSLPKEYVLPSHMSLTDMFKATGNGVPFLASRMIARTVKDFLVR